LVFSSNYFRLFAERKHPIPLINLHEWNPSIISKLNEIGFFQLLNIDDIPNLTKSDNNLKTLKFFTGVDGGGLEQAENQLLELAAHVDEDSEIPKTFLYALNSAFSEAMINVSKHAYDKTHQYQYPHQGKFFFTGAAKKDTREMTFAVYDHGATIPVTYPKTNMQDRVKDYVQSISNLFSKVTNAKDGAYISSAIRFGNTQTNQEGRGRGLPQIREAIDLCNSGSFTVVSRSGMYTYSHGGNESFSAFEGTIGGTLISWRVVLP